MTRRIEDGPPNPVGERTTKCTYIYVDSPRNQERGRVGHQCGFAPENNGTGRCKYHGGRNPRLVNVARRQIVQSAMDADISEGRFTGLWPTDHELLDPYSLMLWEIRRSGWRIEWFDVKIREVKEEKDMWWGITKEESVGASEWAGTNRTYEARENILIKMQNEERKRLFDLTKEWNNARFEAARVATMGAFAVAAKDMVRSLLEALGQDLDDEGTQQMVARVLAQQPPLLIEGPVKEK